MALVLRPPQRRLPPSPAFGSKVAIDWSHPLALGMTDCLVWSGGTPVNLASPSSNTSLTGSPTSVLTEAGPAGYSTGGSAYNIPDHGNIAAGDFAIRVLFKPVTWTGGFASLFEKGLSGNRELGVFFNTSGNVTFCQIGNASISGASTGLAAATVGDFVISRTGTTLSYFANGNFISSTAATGTTAEPFALCFGANPTGGGSNGDTQYITSQIWSRSLSTSEVGLLYSDPYCFLLPPEGEMPALFTAAAGAFLAAWARGSNLPVLGTGTY